EVSPTAEGDPQALDGLLGPLADRVRGAGAAKDHLQLLMSLLFLRASGAGYLPYLAQTRPPTDDAVAAYSWLLRIGDVVDRRLRVAVRHLTVLALHPKLDPVESSPWHSSTWPRHQADLIVMNPPFNGASSPGLHRSDADWPFGPPPPGNDNFAWLQHAFACLADGGRAAVVMPSNAGTSAHLRERAIRRAMLAYGAVECVLALPPQLFARTPIAVSVWILRKTKVPDGQVLLINARELGVVSRGRRILSAEDRAA